MRRLILLLPLLLSAFLLDAQNVICRDGRSDYQIVIPSDRDDVHGDSYYECCREAAHVLQQYLQQSTGVCLSVVTEDRHDTLRPAFFIGDVESLALLPDRRESRVVYDGYLLRSYRGNYYLYANEGKGLVTAAYRLLENYVGMRVYTPSAVVVPRHDVLVLPEMDRVDSPAFSYREVLYFYPNHSQMYADFHGLHNRKDIVRNWGMFVHTFRHLIPVERYFENHPGWFSEINGRRVKDGQLCLANTDVLDTLCANLGTMMAQKPDAMIWSVSNNDNFNRCTCPHCRRLDSIYGGPSGTLLYFINQVADRFPDKTISTLAYQYTRQAPKSDIAPRPNVQMMFCSIECGRHLPIATNPSEVSFRRDMEDWSAKTNNIFVWDYVVQFRSMMNPFPNLHVLKPNLQYFRDHGVKEMFEQGTGADNKTAWMELRTYLLAKLMWNPDLDVDSLARDFCMGYYGPAAQPIKEFYDGMHRSLVESARPLNIYGYPTDGARGYLNPERMRDYVRLIEEAYHLAKGDSIVTDRIRYLELSLDYAKLELGMSGSNPDLAFLKGEDRVLNPKMVELADRFVNDCKRFGIGCLVEMGRTPDQYRADVDNYILKSSQKNLAYHAEVTLAKNPDLRYDPANPDSPCGLVDGIAGQLNYFHDWLGFYNSEMDAAIDLGVEKEIKEVKLDFFFYPLSWIFVPESVDLYTSRNGRRWQHVATLYGSNPEELARPDIHNFWFKDLRLKTRHLRVVAHPIPSVPDWHRAVGNPVWIFCDEILVR